MLKKRAIIYARVSTDDQAERGYSLQSQLENCRRYATNNEFIVISEISDDCSGMSLDRPGLVQVLDLISKGETDAVVVHASDRWTRKLAHSLILREDLLNAGVELHYVNRGKTEDTPESRMMENIEGVFNEYWREKIVESCKRGKNTKARNNKPVMIGHPPYGYEKVGMGNNAGLVINEDQARIVRLIYHWYLIGKNGSGPLSLRAIAKELDEMGAPLPNGKKVKAKCWHPFTVRNILTNEIYIGKTYYGKVRVENGQRAKQPREKWIEIDVPELAMIDVKLFKKVQDRASRNQAKSKRNRKRQYLLVGHIRCDSCDYAMVGTCKNPSTKPVKYYRCSSYTHKHQYCEHQNRNVPVQKVDDKVWGWLVGLISDEEKLVKGVQRMVERAEADIEPKMKRLETLNNLKRESDQKIQRLMSDLGDENSETIRLALKAQITSIAKEIDALDEERLAIEEDLE